MSEDRVTQLQEFVAHSARVNCLAIGKSTGKFLATGGDDKKVNIWQIGKPNAIATLSEHSSAVETVQFDSTDEIVVAGSSSGTIKLWKIRQGKHLRSLTGHKSNIRALHFHPFGDFIASGSNDTTLKIWDIRGKKCIQTYKGHTDAINVVKFSPDGHWMVSGGEDGVVKLWDLSAGKQITEFKDHSDAITSIEFHPTEFLLSTGSADRTVRFWDLESFRCVSTSRPEASRVRCTTFDPRGDALYTGGNDSFRAYAWEPESTLDGFPTSWGRVADMHIKESDPSSLIGASFQAESVSVWLVDLNKVNKDRSKAKQLPGSYISSSSNDRPATSSSNNSKPAEDREKTKPSRTLPKVRTTTAPVSSGADADASKAFESKPKIARERPATTSGTSSTSAEGAGSTVVKSSGPRVSSTVDKNKATAAQLPPAAAAAAAAVPTPAPARTAAPASAEPVQETATVTASQTLKKATWNKNKETPNIPSTRDKPLDLNVAEFLPTPLTQVQQSVEQTEDEILASMHSGHAPMIAVMAGRTRNIQVVRKLWTSSSPKQALDQLVDLEDNATLVDILNVMLESPSTWTLDAATAVLPAFENLITSQYESFVLTACNATTMIVKNFGSLILDTIKAAKVSRGVDLSQEQRYEKCSSCYESLKIVKQALQERQGDSAKMRSALDRAVSTLERF